MALEDEIVKAIGAHAVWKMRLKAAIDTGQSEFQVAVVQQDNQCPFGKWLYAAQANVRASADYKKVQEMHARFHREAASVLELALKGNKAEAEKRMAVGGAFAQLSSELIAAMTAWKGAQSNS
jgi:hypothetical protein